MSVDVQAEIAVYDVFADRPFNGNPAAVVRAGRKKYSDSQLLTLAAELAFPETALYVGLGRIPSFRFSTADRLVKRCGHATLAAVADHFLNQNALLDADAIEYTGHYRVRGLQADWKITNVSWRPLPSRCSYLDVSVSWPDIPRFVSSLPAKKVYEALNLDREEGVRELPPIIYDSGNRNALVSVMGLSQLKRAKPYWPTLGPLFDKYKLTDMHLFCFSPNHKVSSKLRCRNIFPYGVFEECATGTASIALSALLVDRFMDLHWEKPPTTFVFEQGIGPRRGNLRVTWDTAAEKKPKVWLSGRVFPIIRGDLFVKPN